MKRFRFKKIDAFTNGESRGNPAACLYPEDDSLITPGDMQRIARELKGFVNEAVYLFPGGRPSLRYYSSECEVDFCGHGTVAAMYDYINSHRGLSERDEIIITVRGEELAVMNRISAEDSVYVQAPKRAKGAPLPNAEETASVLGVDPSIFHRKLPMRVIRCGLTALIVPLSGLAQCLDLSPDEERLKGFCLEKGIDIVVVFTAETSPGTCRFRSRVFAAKFGYLEDPATGSGNSALGHYLLDNGLWKGEALSIEQGPDRDSPNIVRIVAPAGGDGKLLFGGSAAVRIEGEYILGISEN